MRADEIREMGKDDIDARIKELEEEQFRLKFRGATEPLDPGSTSSRTLFQRTVDRPDGALVIGR